MFEKVVYARLGVTPWCGARPRGVVRARLGVARVRALVWRLGVARTHCPWGL